MRNGFITIWLISIITLVMGCASTPQSSHEQIETKHTTHITTCNGQTTVPKNYPWSIPGYHDTIAKQFSVFRITQTRGNHKQFTLCSDCPCPTPKRVTKASVAVAKKNAADNLKKVVIYFDQASYQLNQRQQQTLTRLYQSLPDEYQLKIIGYTDDTVPGGTVTNEALAQHRAQAVLDFLMTLGIDEEHTTVKASPLCCYVASNTTDSGRALNRRTEIIIVSSSSTNL